MYIYTKKCDFQGCFRVLNYRCWNFNLLQIKWNESAVLKTLKFQPSNILHFSLNAEIPVKHPWNIQKYTNQGSFLKEFRVNIHFSKKCKRVRAKCKRVRAKCKRMQAKCKHVRPKCKSLKAKCKPPVRHTHALRGRDARARHRPSARPRAASAPRKKRPWIAEFKDAIFFVYFFRNSWTSCLTRFPSARPLTFAITGPMSFPMFCMPPSIPDSDAVSSMISRIFSSESCSGRDLLSILISVF